MIDGDPVELRQLILNLLLNAMDAVSKKCPNERVVCIQSEAPSEGVIHVSVEDSGEGVPQNVAEHVFEPFYTTKPNGLGMGLSIAKSIVESHRGSIWLTRGTHRGSSLRVLSAGRRIGSMTDPTIRVALVDDDPSVRRALARLLRCVGFEVTCYECVKAFLRDFTAANTVDCAIVDVRMPGETGLALAEFVRTAEVTIPVILITGDADATLAERAARCGAFALLNKPLGESVVIDAIRAAVLGKTSDVAGRAGLCGARPRSEG